MNIKYFLPSCLLALLPLSSCDILMNVATQYLKSKTFSELTSLYQPSITASLDKPLIGGISASQSWNEIRTDISSRTTDLLRRVFAAI